MPDYVLKRINGTQSVLKGDIVGPLIYEGSGNIRGVNGGYFRLPRPYPLAGAASWEFKFNASNVQQGGNTAVVVGGENNFGFFVLAAYKYLGIYLSSNDTSWDIAENVNTQMPYTMGESYYYKIGYDGTRYYAEYNTDGSDVYTRTWTLVSNKKITGSGLGTLLGYAYIRDGFWANASINLAKCSLTVDGKVVWTGMKQVSKVEDYVLKRSLGRTNCLTSVPENIKLELSNGRVIIKAGSKIYVPNGFESNGTTPKFDEVVLSSDVNLNYTYAPSTNVQCMLFINNKGTGFISTRLVAACFSGATQPEGDYRNWYNTMENKMYSIGTNATVDATGFSFPVAIITQGPDGVTKSIDQIFQWCGYIGSEQFFLPGLKGLKANGFNADGTYKNIEVETKSVILNEYNYSAGNQQVFIARNGTYFRRIVRYYSQETEPAISTYSIWHNTKDNFNYVTNSDTSTGWVKSSDPDFLAIADITTDSSYQIISITPATVRTAPSATKTYLFNKKKYRDVTNVNVVGSPTIVDNVVSGFSTTNYVTMPVSIPTYGYELVFGINTGQDVATRQSIIGNTTNDNSFMLCIRDGKFILIDKISGATEENCISLGGTILPNTSYLIKIVNTGTDTKSATSLYYSTDHGASYTLACVIATQDEPWLNPCPFGQPSTRDSVKEAFKGSIDFTNAYLKSGNKVIWTGKKTVKY